MGKTATNTASKNRQTSCGEIIEAGDTDLTNPHQLHRFALHVPNEAELGCRFGERQKIRKEHLETMKLQKQSAYQCGTQQNGTSCPCRKR